jgi:DNA mismatch endonuclease (patch repair protein)
MTDNVTPEKRRWTMAQVHSENTSPEMRVRKAIHAAGFRYRLYRKDLPGKPDLTLSKYRIVVFVHGCFWHWHGCKRSRMPSSNTEYWRRKIDNNVRRDRENLEKLKNLGWEPVIVWECELKEGSEALIEKLRGLREKF